MSKRLPLLILAITSAIGSKVFFISLNDSEGSNLLINVLLTGLIFLLSLLAYKFIHATTGLKRLLLTILVQVIVVFGFVYLLG